MSKNKIVFSIGAILFIMPLFLGLPQNWENFIQIVFGITLMVLSFSVAAKRRAGARRSRRIKEKESVSSPAEIISPSIAILPDEIDTSIPEEDNTDKPIAPSV